MCWLTVLDAILSTDARGALHETGTGAAYCQIIDSIFGDVPMNRVKFEAKQEYEYLANYRILQNSFKVHSIDKVSRCARSCSTVSSLTRTLLYTHRSGRFSSVSSPPPRLPFAPQPIPVDRLVRCKMQDNLEFMQWLKRFWDMNFPGGDYDPVARRGGAGARAPSASGAGAGKAPVASTSAAPAARRPPPGELRPAYPALSRQVC